MQPHTFGPPPHAAPAGVRICPGCGVVAPLARTSCKACSAPLPPQPLVAPGRVGPAVLVCLHEADFACKACGVRSPLATLDCEGQAECMGCGLRQDFDPAQWTDALGFAHGVADLSGPNLDPVSARSRHAKLGTEFTSSTKTQNTMIMDGRGQRTLSLKVTASPGHPVCRACHVPLHVWVEGAVTKTQCARCGDAAAYGLPAGAKAAYGAIVGVLAAEQRVDRPVARIGRTSAGVESIVCPQCGAGISAGAGSELVKCTYCSLAVRIPGTLARQQRRGALPKMEPFWVLLEGPSIGRQRLAAGKAEDPDDDDDDDDDEPEAAAPAWAPAPIAFAAAPPPRSNTAGIVAGVVVTALVLCGAGFAVYMLTQEPDEPAAAAQPKAAAAPNATAARPAASAKTAASAKKK